MAGEGRYLEVKWMAVGMALLGVLVAAVSSLRGDTSPAQQVAFKATRVDLVDQMGSAIARAGEAERSAVLATTDEASQAFAEQARAGLGEVEVALGQLGGLAGKGSPEREKEQLARFAKAFQELKQGDEEVLRLAVQNTNLKAYALAFGPAAQALSELEAPLARLAEQASGSIDGHQVVLHALGARVAALHVQALLAPHIAEESDAAMDRMEATLKAELARARQELSALVSLPSLKGSAEVATAAAALDRYAGLEARILALSRENTNVRSLALTLNQERKTMAVALEAQAALKQAILAEPIPGVTYGLAPNPRR
jgi:heme exporter protein D